MSRFLRNVGSNFFVSLVEAAILIILTPFVVRSLGVEQYAVWVIIQTIGYFLSFFDLGLPDAQVQRHAILYARGQLAKVGRLHGTVLIVFFGAGVAAFVAALGLGLALPTELLDLPPEGNPGFYLLLFALIGLSAWLSFLDLGLDGMFEGYQRFDLMNAIDVIIDIAAAICVVGALALGYGLIALALIELFAGLLGLVAKVLVARRSFPLQAFPVLRFDRESWLSVRGNSWWNCLNDFMTEGTAQLGKLAIPVLLGSALVTPYSLGVSLATAIFVLAEPLTDVFLPITAARYSSKDKEALTTLLVRGTKLVTMASLPIAIVVGLFGPEILDAWVGNEYVDLSRTFLAVTAADFFISAYLMTAMTLIMGAGGFRKLFLYSAIEVGSVLILIVALTPGWGLEGFAIAGLLANVATGLLLFLPAACQLTNLTTWRLLGITLVPMVLAAIPGVLVGAYLGDVLDSTNLIGLITTIAGVLVLSVSLMLGFGSSGWERARYLVIFRRLSGFQHG